MRQQAARWAVLPCSAGDQRCLVGDL